MPIFRFTDAHVYRSGVPVYVFIGRRPTPAPWANDQISVLPKSYRDFPSLVNCVFRADVNSISKGW